jgi:hypothetical protein
MAVMLLIPTFNLPYTAALGMLAVKRQQPDIRLS